MQVLCVLNITRSLFALFRLHSIVDLSTSCLHDAEIVRILRMVYGECLQVLGIKWETNATVRGRHVKRRFYLYVQCSQSLVEMA